MTKREESKAFTCRHPNRPLGLSIPDCAGQGHQDLNYEPSLEPWFRSRCCLQCSRWSTSHQNGMRYVPLTISEIHHRSSPKVVDCIVGTVRDFSNEPELVVSPEAVRLLPGIALYLGSYELVSKRLDSVIGSCRSSHHCQGNLHIRW